MKITTIDKVKRGEYVRLKGKKRVYIYQGKDRTAGYELQAWDDIGYSRHFKKAIEVEIDFDF